MSVLKCASLIGLIILLAGISFQIGWPFIGGSFLVMACLMVGFAPVICDV